MQLVLLYRALQLINIGTDKDLALINAIEDFFLHPRFYFVLCTFKKIYLIIARIFFYLKKMVVDLTF